MAKRKRRFEQMATADPQPKEKPRYQDAFQQNVGQRIEDVGKKFEGRGRNILYGLAAVAVLALLIGIFYTWYRRNTSAAQTALGKAIETSQARVSDEPVPAASNEKTFKTEKERAEAAIAEFQNVASSYGGSVGEKAKYFIAVNRLTLDRPAGIQELQGLAASNDEVGKLSKFALAQASANDGKFDEAAALYQELAGMADPVISKETINFELAKIYEMQGKKQEAADLYFNIAKTATELKDLDGKPVTLTQTARSAKEKVEELDPERAREIKEPEPTNPFGSGGLPIQVQ